MFYFAVKEVYVGAGGVQKVWPAYTDYGDMYILYDDTTSGVLTYGYWAYRTTVHKCSVLGHTADTTVGAYPSKWVENYTTNLRYTNTTDPNYTYPNWYAPSTPIDLRGYNYLFCVINATICTNSSRYRAGGAPIFSIGDAPDESPLYDSNVVVTDDYFYGIANELGSDLHTTSEVMVIVDISNCQSENKYFKIGVNAYCNYDDDDDGKQSYSATLMYSERYTAYAALAKTEDDIVYPAWSGGSTDPKMYLTGKD